ncbi:MAG: DUF2807 domain-containing protein [Bacteroidales bacterium]|nr:DUF2807 domain-containing protein [Bacteroidales bacterium]
MKTGRDIVKGLITLFFLTGLFSMSYAQHEKAMVTEPFTRIEAEGKLQIYLIPADTHKIRIVTNKTIAEPIEYEINNGSLEIESKQDIKDSFKKEDIEVYLYFKELKEIEAEGMVRIDTKKEALTPAHLKLSFQGAVHAKLAIEVEKLTSEISGAAKLTITGKATHHQLEASGAANIKAYELATQTTHAEISGASVAYVKASEKLTGSRSGVAQLHYKDQADMVDINESESVEGIIEKEISRNHYEDSVKVKLGKIDFEVIDSDTTVIRMGRSKISIDDKGNINIGKEDKKQTFNGHWSGFYLGINGYMTNDDNLTPPDNYDELDLTYEKSIDVQLNIFEQNFNLVREKLGLVTGLGLHWNNYRFDNDVKLDGNADTLAFEEPDADKNYEKSKLVATYLTVPLFLEYQTNDDNDADSFHISAGAVGGLRIGAHSKNIVNGNKSKQRQDFHLSPFRADAAVRIGWGKINLYGSYGLVTLFKNDKGPELYPFSVGIQVLGL